VSVALAARHTDTAALTPIERLELVCDRRSLELIRTEARSAAMGDQARPGDGVVAGAGLVDGRPVFCYAQDSRYAGGSLGHQHADTIVRVLELADRARAPVVGFVSSGGARMQEGTAALGGYGRIFQRTVALSGRVPQVSIVTGLSAGGGAYSPALTDWLLMTADASMFLTGPGVVREALGEQVTPDQLGGTRIHARNGVCHFVAEHELEAASVARELIGHVCPPPGGRSPREPSPPGDPGSLVPGEPRRVYDVREVTASLVDGGELLELSSGWARNLVTGFARVDGRSVGVIANQPRYLGGVLDAASSEKGAEFVSKCDAFGIPLLVLVDTPGYMPGSRQEAAGVIRCGAMLVRAFARASVPRITLILRKAFGGAYITMNSKELGADYVFAWPSAEIGVMAAKPAVGIIHRRHLAACEDPDSEQARLAEHYASAQLKPEVAARNGHIDELIAPSQSRARIAWALRSLGSR
jgi:acetyl-CoA carboxylase carboxyltransferase component